MLGQHRGLIGVVGNVFTPQRHQPAIPAVTQQFDLHTRCTACVIGGSKDLDPAELFFRPVTGLGSDLCRAQPAVLDVLGSQVDDVVVP